MTEDLFHPAAELAALCNGTFSAHCNRFVTHSMDLELNGLRYYLQPQNIEFCTGFNITFHDDKN
jgi:hypothetical protein